jgi:hypothetical protein
VLDRAGELALQAADAPFRIDEDQLHGAASNVCGTRPGAL